MQDTEWPTSTTSRVFNLYDWNVPIEAKGGVVPQRNDKMLSILYSPTFTGYLILACKMQENDLDPMILKHYKSPRVFPLQWLIQALKMSPAVLAVGFSISWSAVWHTAPERGDCLSPLITHTHWIYSTNLTLINPPIRLCDWCDLWLSEIFLQWAPL